MSGWGFNLSNLKTLGDKLQDGLSELERNLAQPVVRNDLSTPSPPSHRPSSSTQSPSRTSSVSSPSRTARPTPHPLVTDNATPRASVDSVRSSDTGAGAGSPNAERSASELATGAMSSLREQLKRKRLAAEAARNGGANAGGGMVVKPRDEPPPPTSPAQQEQLIDIAQIDEIQAQPLTIEVSLLDADDEPTPTTTVGTTLADEPGVSLVDVPSTLPSTLASPLKADSPTTTALPSDTKFEPLSYAQAANPSVPAPPSPPLPTAPASEPTPTLDQTNTLDAASPVDYPTSVAFEVDPAAPVAQALLQPSSPDLFAIASTADATPLDGLTREGTPAPVEAEAEKAKEKEKEVAQVKEEPVIENGTAEGPVSTAEDVKVADEPEVEAAPTEEAAPAIEVKEQAPKPTVEACSEAEDRPAPFERAAESRPEFVAEVEVAAHDTASLVEVDEPQAEPEAPAPAEEFAPPIEAILEARSTLDAVAPEEGLEQAKAEEAAEPTVQADLAAEPVSDEQAESALPFEKVSVIGDLVEKQSPEVSVVVEASEPEPVVKEDAPVEAVAKESAPEPEPVTEPEAVLQSTSAPDEPLVEPTVELPKVAAPAAVVEEELAPVSVAKEQPAPPALATAALDARLSEMTAAFERLQTLTTTLDRIVSEVTPLSGVQDVDAFEGELRNMKGKTEMSMQEIGRLTGDLKLQKERFAELRDAHRQESRSQTERIDDLTAQLASKDSALALLASKLEKADKADAAAKAEVTKLKEEAVKLQQTASGEEEKRTKALSLLRALRQKLVKTEKDREEAEKSRDELQARIAQAGDGSKADRVRFEQEVVSLRAAQQGEIAKLRASFERDVQAQKAAAEREAGARKAQFELGAITATAQHNKELQARQARVAQLEKTVKELGSARDELFDQVQVRTAEAESAGAHQQSLQSHAGELQYELQEARDKAAALLEEVEELRKARRDVARDEVNTRRLLAEAEARHEAKIRDLTARARGMEKERQEAADEASKQLAERLKEVERMRETIAQKDKEYDQSVTSAKVSEAKITEADKKRAQVEKDLKEAKSLLASVKEDQAEAVRTEAALREELTERASRSAEIESRLEEVVAKESQLRSNNKILRDELRKLQSGVALRETARAPGVGYFAQRSESGVPPPPGSGAMSPQSDGGVASPTLSQSQGRSGSIYGASGPGPLGGSTLSLVAGGAGANPAQASEEAINFEYLRNLLLQFLEKPEMRPHLISVMSVVMRFTPAEQRRLVAKAGGK